MAKVDAQKLVWKLENRLDYALEKSEIPNNPESDAEYYLAMAYNLLIAEIEAGEYA